MRLNKLIMLLLLLIATSGCGGSGVSSGAAASSSTSATLVSLAITPANATMAQGTDEQFTATGTFSDRTTQDLSSSVIWGSSASSVATVSNAAGSNGRVTSLTSGSTTITAVSGGISASSPLTVSTATLLSVTVTPAAGSVPLATSQQFSATGRFSDNSTQDLTASASWSSSFPSIATISNSGGSQGRVTPVAAGTTSITASVPVTQPAPGNVSGSTTLTVTAGISAQANVLPITVNGSLCSSATSSGYPNKPCVSVTVCNPDGTNCQVINDILLDTGSYGLRIFQSALSTFSLTQVSAGSASLAECTEYVDGSSNWGPVQLASITLGGEPAVLVPIQVIDSSFGNLSSRTLNRTCPGAVATPLDAGYTGILGVGLLAQDCGADCVSSPNVGSYYACSGSACSGTTVPLAHQVSNPVALLPTDNNGVIVQMPAGVLGGVSSLSGNLILGIGTRSNNAASGVTAYPANAAAEFTTTFQGQSSASSFIDSGSNALYFAASTALLPQDSSGFFCPAVAVGSSLPFSAVNSGDLGTPSASTSFQIGNFDSLTGTGNNVFSEIGGYQTGGFDWGLPFFFGRSVFVGFDGSSSALGSGPYWAY